MFAFHCRCGMSRTFSTNEGSTSAYETVRAWWNRFGPMFAAEIRKKRSASMQGMPQWRWHLDEDFVRINGETNYLWRAVDHEGEVLEAYVTKKRDRSAYVEISEESDEAARSPSGGCDRWSALLRRSHERDRQRGPSSDRTMAQQQSRKFTSAAPATRTGDGEIHEYEVASEIHRHPFFNPQSFQSRTTSLQSTKLQTQPFRRIGRVASTCKLKLNEARRSQVKSLLSDSASARAGRTAATLRRGANHCIFPGHVDLCETCCFRDRWR